MGKLNLRRGEAVGFADRSVASGLSCWNPDFLLTRLEERELSLPECSVLSAQQEEQRYLRDGASVNRGIACQALSTVQAHGLDNASDGC